ncbi:NAD(P)-dependent oxidoreductase [Streptomyces sp. NPDC005925]|uniref:NAD-dependent epimerase/dehydratase family protein n=1 Tax=Streptomyces sp. NPDC005925 TaxID=3157172 RepID=UPI0033FF4FC5
MDQLVLITGAAGNMGRMLRDGLRRPMRLTDSVPEEGCARASVTDLDAMRAAMRGVSAVVHLAGITDEDTWERIVDVNVDGTRTVLEAARLEGVRQVVLASSNHAVGFQERGTGELPGDVPARPDTYYGFSKAAGEALGALYHDRFGMNVVCLRIGTCYDKPFDVRSLSTWLSPADAVRLVDAALDAEGYHLVWGVSDNTRRWWSLETGKKIGYEPQDDAEVFAAEMEAKAAGDRAADLGGRYVGGFFCALPLGQPPVG